MGLWRGIVLLLAFMIIGRGEGQLVENFYSSSCPNVESIVQQAVSTKFSQTFTTIPATLRLFFHDCFVEVLSFCLSCINLLKIIRCLVLILLTLETIMVSPICIHSCHLSHGLVCSYNKEVLVLYRWCSHGGGGNWKPKIAFCGEYAKNEALNY